jgi:hypothetical protein
VKTYIKLIVIGLALALLAIFLFGFASPVVALQLYALLLAYTACLYAGAALSDGRASWLGVEVGVSAVIFGCAFLGLWQSSRWLALGYVLHGLWDLCHHPRRIRTRVVDWFPPICATFDFAVAIFISVWY